jgi:hypothetical protein
MSLVKKMPIHDPVMIIVLSYDNDMFSENLAYTHKKVIVLQKCDILCPLDGEYDDYGILECYDL